MGKIIETLIDRFDGGIAKDAVSKDASQFGITKHFDAFTFPFKLVPFHKTEPNETKSMKIVKFVYAPTNYPTNTTFRIFGLGIVSSTTKPAVYSYDIDAGIPDSTSWATPPNNAATGTGRSEDVFFYYKGYLYMFRGSTLVRYDTSGGTSFDDSYQSISWTNVAQPLRHPSDDCAYFFADNVVYRLNGTSWDGAVLTLPADMKITSATADGNFLSIACSTLGTAEKNSIVYKWDRDSSLTTLTERVDFGQGEIKHLASLDNNLTAVVDFYTTNLYSLNRPKVLIKQANGAFAKTLTEIILDSTITAADFPATRQVTDNILYFPLKAPLNGDSRNGIWAVNGQGKATLAFIEEEATSYQGIFSHANFWWIAHSGDGSVNRSDDNRTFSSTNPAIYESLRFNNGDLGKLKKLIGVTVTNRPLPSTAGTKVTLKYRKNEETSWTTIFENSTTNSISHDAVNIESTGADLPEFQEIQFRIESVGASITGFGFKSEVLDNQPY